MMRYYLSQNMTDHLNIFLRFFTRHFAQNSMHYCTAYTAPWQTHFSTEAIISNRNADTSEWSDH